MKIFFMYISIMMPLYSAAAPKKSQRNRDLRYVYACLQQTGPGLTGRDPLPIQIPTDSLREKARLEQSKLTSVQMRKQEEEQQANSERPMKASDNEKEPIGVFEMEV
jgi:hypothetical protein